MALIEHLERDNWEEFLSRSFEYALDVLKNDRFRSVGSAVDDLRSWLARGGINRVKERLNDQMEMRQFSPERRAEVNRLLEQLGESNRTELLALMADGTIAVTEPEWLAAWDVSAAQFQDMLNRILAGERPFEDWMYAHGRSEEDVAEIYRLIDEWLARKGLIPPPRAVPRLN